MSTIINTYPVFENSQVLTSAQLNQMVTYLDQQNRLTRVKLIGIGIVCGLELTYESGTNTRITISKGTAITSKGFLITLGDCETSYYRPYVLPEGVQYKPFGDPEQDVTLYELLKAMPEDPTGVEALDNPSDFPDDKFVLLFLECFDNDLKSCLGQTCDDLGIDRIFTVRKLLISKADLDKVLDRSGNVGNLYPAQFTLPDIVMPRPLFDPGETHSIDYTAFSILYTDTFKNTVYPALFGALTQTYTTYQPLLGPVYGFVNPFETATVNALKNTWTAFIEGTASPGPTYRGIQYFHDFVKDLILAYYEFRECAFDLMSECCPDMSLFPRHVMLGRANVPLETEEESKSYRHGFAQPPIYNQQKYLVEKTISLHKRMVLMVEKFNLNIINDPAGSVEVRITPSREKNTPLSHRSIPYYYKSKETSSVVGPGTLERYWNFDTSRTKSISVTPLVISYENQRSDQSSPGTPFETPLYYNIDDYPFLRIEGHISKDVETAVDTINNLMRRFNLPFDTVTLQLDAGTIKPDYHCGFEDIQEEYIILKNLLCSVIDDLFILYQFVDTNQEIIFGENDDDVEDLEQIEPIMDELQELCELLPECIHEIDFPAFQQRYKASLQLIIDFILIHYELLHEIKLKQDGSDIEVVNGIMQRISPVIYKLIDLTFYTKLYRLYYAFKRREHYLINVLPATATFKGYLTKNPGVEHQAGVYKGGTFILLYHNSGDQAVIADFSLPYRCCATDHCVPMCDKPDDGFDFYLMPFARPDYAITLVDKPVDIDVLINDVAMAGGEYTIDHDEGSEEGGEVESASEKGPLKYTPPKGFAGIDSFRYRLLNENGDEDEGQVTILITQPSGEAEGCYTAEHMNCWGIGRVRQALKARSIDSGNMSDSEAVSALVADLQNTTGFSLEEINEGVLKDPDSKMELLICIGYIHEGDSAEQLGQRILDYQRDHCGMTINCTVTSISGRVTDNSGNPLPGIKIIVMGTAQAATTDANGNYTLEIGYIGATIRAVALGFLEQQIEVCNEAVIDIKLEKIQPGDVEVNIAKFDLQSLTKIANARNIPVEEPQNRTKLISDIIGSEKGSILNKEELKLLTRDGLRAILEDKRISYSATDLKDHLINKLVGS